jgi:glutathione S-transferase
MPKLTLWQYEISPFSDKVRRAAFLKDLDFEIREVLISETGKLKTVSPTGKFPVLEAGGRYIVDSTDILDYFEDLKPDPPLTPNNPRDAALAVILEDWADESLYFYDLTLRSWPQNVEWLLDDLLVYEPKGLKHKLLRKLIPRFMPKATKSQGIGRKDQAVVVQEITTLFQAVDALLEDAEWLAGGSISRADISVRAMTFVINRAVEGRAALDALPNIRKWEARVDKRTLPKPANNDRPARVQA